MDAPGTDLIKTLDKVLTGLLIVAAAVIVASVAWGLDTQDMTMEWTAAKKPLAMQIPTSTGRLCIDQMVPQPCSRYGVTEQVQPQIVPPLIRQEP